MLRMNIYDAGRQDTETQKRVEIYKSVGYLYIYIYIYIFLSLSFFLYIYLSFFLSLSFSITLILSYYYPSPFPPSHARRAEENISMFVTQAGRTQRHEKRVDIYKSASVACGRATGAGQTVCDTDRQAGRTHRYEKGLTFIRV